MILQLLSDLHLETESFTPQPAPGAELLVLAGDIDAGWEGWSLFADWPVPVVAVAGNHEFDGRELRQAWPAFRAHLDSLGIRLLERESLIHQARDGRRVRLLGTVRWCDFDVFGEAGRERAMRAAGYYLKVMGATLDGQPIDAALLRDEALACRAWLAAELARPNPGAADGGWDATIAITHFAPSLKSADPRYGRQPGTASFCNADDDLISLADLWLHGHLHCRHDYAIERPEQCATRVVCQAAGLAKKGEQSGFDPLKLLQLPGP
ncbi:MAG: metallophosphoesterase [Burkholderiaceae bacterium]|nr:metallophosphoesterase [Burkholderiaceae bacterium]